MAIKVYAVRVGNKYGLQYENYLKSKLNITFLNTEEEGFKLQWNKLHFFNLNLDEPVCVIDIDILLINDYQALFNLPIQRGQFLTLNCWWDDRPINGGFYKFYPKDVRFVYEEFKERQQYWEQYFIKNGTKPGPVNGEEDFVYHLVHKNLELKYAPASWATKMQLEPSNKELSNLNTKYPGGYCYIGQKFNDNIKLVHYAGLNQLHL